MGGGCRIAPGRRSNDTEFCLQNPVTNSFGSHSLPWAASGKPGYGRATAAGIDFFKNLPNSRPREFSLSRI